MCDRWPECGPSRTALDSHGAIPPVGTMPTESLGHFVSLCHVYGVSQEAPGLPSLVRRQSELWPGTESTDVPTGLVPSLDSGQAGQTTAPV